MMATKVAVGIAVLSGPHHRDAMKPGSILPGIPSPLEVSKMLIESVDVNPANVSPYLSIFTLCQWHNLHSGRIGKELT